MVKPSCLCLLNFVVRRTFIESVAGFLGGCLAPLLKSLLNLHEGLLQSKWGFWFAILLAVLAESFLSFPDLNLTSGVPHYKLRKLPPENTLMSSSYANIRVPSSSLERPVFADCWFRREFMKLWHLHHLACSNEDCEQAIARRTKLRSETLVKVIW